MTKERRTWFRRRRWLDADDFQQTLEWIGANMATQEDVNILKEDLDAIKTGIAAQSERIAGLTAQLASVQGADLTGVIAEANDIKANLDSVAQAPALNTQAPTDGAVAGAGSADGTVLADPAQPTT